MKSDNSPSLDKLKKKLKSFFVEKFPTVPLQIVKQDNMFHLILRKKDGTELYDSSVISSDGFSFETSTKKIPYTPLVHFPNAALVPHYQYEGKRVAYFGDRSIHVAFSEDGIKWTPSKQSILLAPYPLEVGSVFVRNEGLLLVYFEKHIKNEVTHYATHFAFFDRKNPRKLLWKTEKPIWIQEDMWPNKKIAPLGSVFHNEQLISYWSVNDEGIFGVILSGFVFDPLLLKKKKIQLKKHISNPILAPQAQNQWEAFNTFNPAAVSVNDRVHILYRAQGFDYISSVGYASSSDGITIDERLDKPIFTPTQHFENNKHTVANYDFMSGGGFGGCEDPRVTQIQDKIYMTYVAFDGWSPPRLALTSIALQDFLSKRWNWTKPVLISPPGIVDKSGCILPEKINGKYVFFHRIFPNILIDFLDDLNFDGKSKWLKGQYKISIRPDKWDSRKIGAGAPPIKTKDGWLLIYYGVDDKDASKYHIGAMILDLKNPTKVLYRSDEPILGPTEEYENSGFKPGVAYPCGAVVKDEELLVYYGGADSVVCVATANLNTFLNELKSKKPVHLHTIAVKEVTY
jgi:predicted GH43/DUF377 family glycosyl hydrolase